MHIGRRHGCPRALRAAGRAGTGSVSEPAFAYAPLHACIFAPPPTMRNARHEASACAALARPNERLELVSAAEISRIATTKRSCSPSRVSQTRSPPRARHIVAPSAQFSMIWRPSGFDAARLQVVPHAHAEHDVDLGECERPVAQRLQSPCEHAAACVPPRAARLRLETHPAASSRALRRARRSTRHCRAPTSSGGSVFTTATSPARSSLQSRAVAVR